jgi:hypothetical protein
MILNPVDAEKTMGSVQPHVCVLHNNIFIWVGWNVYLYFSLICKSRVRYKRIKRVKKKRKRMWVWLVVQGNLEANNINIIHRYRHLLEFD